MQGLKIKSTPKRTLISIDNSLMTEDEFRNAMMEIMNYLRIDYLAKKVGLKKNILKFADEIKKDWWLKNKSEYLKGIKLDKWVK